VDAGERVVLASANPKKAAEIAHILGDRIALVPRPTDVPDVVEDADTFVGNARLKASALVAATGLAALADDSGLEVEALDGAPGVHSARYAGEGGDDGRNVAKLLAALSGLPGSGLPGTGLPGSAPSDRAARFRAVVVVQWPDGREVVAEGTVEGVIADAPRGHGGFGYDPVFVPNEGDGRTFGEMDPDHKHAISHRGRALAELLRQLES